MKFKINKKTIDDVFEIVSKFTDGANAMYSLRCVLIKVENEKITFIASNGSINIIKSINVDDVNVSVEETGSFLIQANIFKAIIKKLSGTISISQEFGKNLIILCKDFKSTLTTSNINDFPQLDKIHNANKMEISTKEFRKAIKSVIFSIGNEGSLIHKCINFNFKKGSINLTATDTYRLSYYSIKTKTNIEESFDVSVDARNVKELLPVDAPSKVTLFYNSIKFGIEYNNTIITSRIVSLPFHDIEHVFTNIQPKYSIKIEKNILSDLLNKVVLGSTEKQNEIELNVTKQEIKLTNKVEEIGTTIAKTKEYTLDGPALSFRFNHTFLKDAISIYDGEVIIIITSDVQRVLVLSKNSPNTKQLFSPLRS